MLFKCPICKERHFLNDNYDNKDYICPNTRRHQKIFQNVVPDDILTKNNYNYNRASTREDIAKPVTIIVNGKPTYKDNGEQIGKKTKVNY